MSKKVDKKKPSISKPPQGPVKKNAFKKENSLKSDSTSKNASMKKESKPNILKEPIMSEEEIKHHKAAIKIQNSYRRFKAVMLLINLRKQKKDMEENLEKLEQEAYISMIKREQELEHQKRMKQLKEKQLMQKRAQRRKKFIDAAYDGNLKDLKNLLKEFENELNSTHDPDLPEKNLDETEKKKALYNLIDCRDSNNNSALSEAAAGGSAEVVKFLLLNNAEPNSKGAFGRTPLWRASFQGHLSCVQLLLENGSDPRIFSDDGQKPSDCSTKPSVADLLNNWNIQLTERMLQQIDKRRNEIKQEQINNIQSKKKEAKAQFDIVNTKYEHIKIELYKCNCELQRLHDEYDLNKEMYGALIDQKENEKIELGIKYEKLREESVKARIGFKELLNTFKREKRKLKKSKSSLDVDDDDEEDSALEDKKYKSESDEDEELNEENFMKINIKELDEMILKDLSSAVKNSKNKWPLLLDSNDVACTYLRYRDTNYINCLNIRNMNAECLRKAIIGAIRFGKPLVFDVMQYDQELLQTLKMTINEIDSNLFEELTSKTIMENERYLKLVKPEVDGKDYDAQNFSEMRLKNFKLLFLTANPYPADDFIKMTLPVKIITSSNKPVDELDLFF